jgi:hypothetical protein
MPRRARKAMAAFAAQSSDADASVVYVGGHGMQHKRMVYWMMGDYPEQRLEMVADSRDRAGRDRPGGAGRVT